MVGAVLVRDLVVDGSRWSKGRQLSADDLVALARPGAGSPTIGSLTVIIPGPDDLHEDAAALRLAAAVAGPGLTYAWSDREPGRPAGGYGRGRPRPAARAGAAQPGGPAGGLHRARRIDRRGRPAGRQREGRAAPRRGRAGRPWHAVGRFREAAHRLAGGRSCRCASASWSRNRSARAIATGSSAARARRSNRWARGGERGLRARPRRSGGGGAARRSPGGAGVGGGAHRRWASTDPPDPVFVGIERARGRGREPRGAGAPGSMLWLARVGRTTILGLPACGTYSKATAVDLLLPRLLAGEPPTLPAGLAAGPRRDLTRRSVSASRPTPAKTERARRIEREPGGVDSATHDAHRSPSRIACARHRGHPGGLPRAWLRLPTARSRRRSSWASSSGGRCSSRARRGSARRSWPRSSRRRSARGSSASSAMRAWTSRPRSTSGTTPARCSRSGCSRRAASTSAPARTTSSGRNS